YPQVNHETWKTGLIGAPCSVTVPTEGVVQGSCQRKSSGSTVKDTYVCRATGYFAKVETQPTPSTPPSISQDQAEWLKLLELDGLSVLSNTTNEYTVPNLPESNTWQFQQDMQRVQEQLNDAGMLTVPAEIQGQPMNVPSNILQ